MIDCLAATQVWLAFPILFLLELVLGIDNVVFLSILVNRLPGAQRRRARLGALALAMVTRIGLLFAVVWLSGLSRPWFYICSVPISAHTVVFLLGGLFLVGSSAVEIHKMLEYQGGGGPRPQRSRMALGAVISQAALIDVVFSLDSVLTAVGLTSDIRLMSAAILLAMIVMLYVSSSLSALLERFPTAKALALAFVMLIGIELIAQALHFEIPKRYLYFAMAFSAGIEALNVRLRANAK